MKNDKARLLLAWVCGLLTFAVLFNLATTLLSAFDIPMVMHFDPITVQHGSGRYSYEEEVSSSTTDAGFGLIGISIMLAVRVGMAIYRKRIDGRLSKRSEIDFMAWLGGLTLFSILAMLAYHLLAELPALLANVIGLAAIAGIFWLCKNWREKKLYSAAE